MFKVSEDRVGLFGVPGVRVAAWSGGRISHGSVPCALGPDLVLVRVKAAEGTLRARFAMASPLEPVLAKFVDASGCTLQVQTFRYVGADGVGRRLLWCGSCGRTITCDLGDLQHGFSTECRACKAGRSDRMCEGWHAFGRCPTCPAGFDVP